MVWYSHRSKNFPLFVMIHTVKGFRVVNEAVVDIFLKVPYFLCDPTNIGNLTSGPSTFSKLSFYIWNFWVHAKLKPRLKGFEYNLAGM